MRPLELLNLIMLGCLCLLTPFALRHQPQLSNWPLMFGYIVMGCLLFVYQQIRVPWFDFPKRFRQVYPVVYIAIIFDSLAYIVPHVQRWRADALLMRLDRMLLGVDPTVYLERYLNPLAVEAFVYVYILYFFLPFLLLWGLWRDRKYDEITRWACMITIALYSNYLLYVVFPAVGPSLHIAHATGKLPDVFLGRYVIAMLKVLESNKFDVFPSAHVNAALVTLYGFWRFHRRRTLPVAAAVLGIMVSTVYLRYHYVVDVLAGVILAAFAVLAGEVYYRRWRRSPAAESIRPQKEEFAGEVR